MESIRPSLKPLWWLYIGVSVVLFYWGMAISATDPSLVAIGAMFVEALCVIATFGYVRQAKFGSSVLWSLALVLSVLTHIGSLLWAVSQGALPLSELLSVPIAAATLVALPSWWASYCYAFRSPHIWSTTPRVQT
jgi:hypothetical protein